MKQLYLKIISMIGLFTNAQSIVGEWETFDDKTGTKL